MRIARSFWVLGLHAAVLALCGTALAQSPAPDAPKPTETRPAASPRRAMPLPDGVRALKDVEYAKPDDNPVKLDLYLPDSKSPTPVVVWVHGGGWRMGSKTFCPATAMCKDGFAVCSVEYRFTDRACFPAQIHDCKAAIRYLRAHAKEYNLDPSRIGAWGASAGGHLVSLLGTTGGEKEEEGNLGNADQSSAVQCVCDWFGPTDFASYPESAEVNPMLVKLFGGKMSDKVDLVKLASPLKHVSKSDPPFLIVQGDKDPLVPLEQSKSLAEALKAAGVDTEFVIVEGEGHGFGGEKANTELKRVRDFFLRHLKPSATKVDKGPDTTTSPSPDAHKPG